MGNPSEWREAESQHFKIIYRSSHSYLVSHILNSAENSLKKLMEIFDYKPKEKIIINTYDVYDFGFAAATAVPTNFIRLEIEPLEAGYEAILFNERFQWLLNHELVHIVVNDNPSKVERIFRSIFGKVSPEQQQPLTAFFSLLTNYDRYTPRWHQEAIAVFIETWLSGGYGRSLSNFDEMYFRAMVSEGKEFPTDIELETILSQNSFLLENIFYLYGTRFITYLAANYGQHKVIEWYKTKPGEFYSSYTGRFEDVFGIDMKDAWNSFLKNEIKFQQKNIKKIKTYPITKLNPLFNEATGWVAQPFYSQKRNSILFGYHKPHNLAGIQELNLSTLKSRKIGDLQTPSIYQVASTAYDSEKDIFFFTTNNNQLFRDIWKLNPETGDEEMLFENCRVGDLTVSPQMHELWGVRHSSGHATLVYSTFPYNSLQNVVSFNVGDNIQNLSVNPDGNFLAAVLHKTNGEQSLILIDLEKLKAGENFKYLTISSKGSPESPSWSPDGKEIYWSAYINGVSNIYKTNSELLKPVPLSNTVVGLFKPVYLSKDSLFAFEFTSDGFMPVIIPNKPVENLSAIEYFGEKIVDKSPEVENWNISAEKVDKYSVPIKAGTSYNSFSNLQVLTFIPIITGFEKQKVLGIFTHISDPLLFHDITLEAGYAPFDEFPKLPKYHVKFKYEFKKQLTIGVDYNAPDFYDLFNTRKRGTIGTKYRIGYSNYWIYNNPLKMKQTTEIALYTNNRFYNDNLLEIIAPDFLVAQTVFNSKDLRKSIGSSNYEKGNEFNITAMAFSANPSNPQTSAQFYAEWDNYSTWIGKHNVLHFKTAGGYHIKNDLLIQSKFFFGGFGNREVENEDVKQYRKVFRFPGIAIYSLAADQFGKFMIENDFPPIRFGNLNIGSQLVNHIDASIYSQGLVVNSFDNKTYDTYLTIGGQINIIFKHWFNLESTFSAGAANAWYRDKESWEWFLSYKLLRN